MAATNKDTMEEIRLLIYGLTLADAFKECRCIHCKNSLATIAGDFTLEEERIWLEEGVCPTCWEKAFQTSELNRDQKRTRRYK